MRIKSQSQASLLEETSTPTRRSADTEVAAQSVYTLYTRSHKTEWFLVSK